MSLTHQTTFSIKNFTYSHLTVAPIHFLNSPKFPNSRTHLPDRRLLTYEPHLLSLVKTNASFQESYGNSQDQSNSSSNELNLDNLLSVVEFLSLTCSTAVSVYIAVCAIQKSGGVLGSVGSKILIWPQIALVSSVVFGAVIRRRQWRRICGVGVSRAFGSSGYGANLLERVEKLEEDLRSSATIIRVLSRQLEKLGIRFRVTRKALKEPIAETAALVQKNSEATRALAAQEDNLEKELGEIQKVLMAMQEQQHKQLELILAIGKAGKLWETKPVYKKQDQNTSEASKSSLDGVVNFKVNQIENNDRP